MRMRMHMGMRSSSFVLALFLLAPLPAAAQTAAAQAATPPAAGVTVPAAKQVAAKPIPVEMTIDEITALNTLLDGAVKCGGLRSAGNAVYLAQKFAEAVRKANPEAAQASQPQPPQEEKKP